MFREAAALLAKEPLSGDREVKARELLQRLGFDEALRSGNHPGTAHAIALFNAAARMSRIFELGSPDAHGFSCIGGTADPAGYGLQGFSTSNVSGRGLDLHQAFKSCVGESVEYLSQLEWGSETFVDAGTIASAERKQRLDQFSAMLGALSHGDSHGLDWMAATSLTSNQTAVLPADLCIRRRGRGAEATPRGFGTGCAAGATLRDATMAALLECVERDAVALWWLGGRRGRLVGKEVLEREVATFLAERRGGSSTGRVTWLLDITTDIGIPCVAAMSADDAGSGLMCGMSARLTLEAAAKSAILELCQMELARHLVLLKLRKEGESALAETDQRHLRRMTMIDATQCALLHPADTTERGAPPPKAGDAKDPVDTLVDRLADYGIESLVVDLTRKEIAVPVARVFTPGLQLLPSPIVTSRLRQAMDVHGGGYNYTGGIDIL